MYTIPMFLHSRIGPITEFVMRLDPEQRRDNGSSDWINYTGSELLDWEFTDESTLVYTRRNHPTAKIILSNLQPGDLSDADIGKPVILSKDLIDRYTDDIVISEGVDYDTTVSHTFSKTTSLKESAEVGAKLGFEASLGYKAGNAGGVEGGVKFSAEISAKYGREWGESSTTTDTVTRHIHIVGPWVGLSIAERSVTRQSITMAVQPNFLYSIEIQEFGETLWKWNSFEEVMQVLEGNGTHKMALAKEAKGHEFAAAELRWPRNSQRAEGNLDGHLRQCELAEHHHQEGCGGHATACFAWNGGRQASPQGL